jgi:hypothetical protein
MSRMAWAPSIPFMPTSTAMTLGLNDRAIVTGGEPVGGELGLEAGAAEGLLHPGRGLFIALDDEHPFCRRLDLLGNRHVVLVEELDEVRDLNPVVSPSGQLKGLEVAPLDPADHRPEVDTAELGDVAGREVAFVEVPRHVMSSSRQQQSTGSTGSNTQAVAARELFVFRSLHEPLSALTASKLHRSVPPPQHGHD